MKLAAVQYRPPKGRPAVAREEIAARAEDAAAAGADLIVFPEMATTGYIWNSSEELQPHAELAQGPTFQRLSPIAAQHGCWIVVGFPELGEDDTLYNSALIIDADGSLAGCYRKVLLFEADHPWATPGSRRPTFDTELGRIAPAICMDMNDPTLAPHLVRSAPDILALPLNWLEQEISLPPYWLHCVAPWRGWIVAANTWGSDSGTTFAGRSTIISPEGEVVAEAASEGDALLLHDA